MPRPGGCKYGTGKGNRMRTGDSFGCPVLESDAFVGWVQDLFFGGAAVEYSVLGSRGVGRVAWLGVVPETVPLTALFCRGVSCGVAVLLVGKIYRIEEVFSNYPERRLKCLDLIQTLVQYQHLHLIQAWCSTDFSSTCKSPNPHHPQLQLCRQSYYNPKRTPI
jgi:hypothetical protein